MSNINTLAVSSDAAAAILADWENAAKNQGNVNSPVRAAFVLALGRSVSIAAELAAAFDAARAEIIGDDDSEPARKKLRKTLLIWAEESGINEDTASGIISDLMVSSGLRIRKAKETPADESAMSDRQKQVNEVTKLLTAQFPALGFAELANLMQAMRRHFEKLAKEAAAQQAEAAEKPAQEAPAVQAAAPAPVAPVPASEAPKAAPSAVSAPAVKTTAQVADEDKARFAKRQGKVAKAAPAQAELLAA
jgi:hypothetical protein